MKSPSIRNTNQESKKKYIARTDLIITFTYIALIDAKRKLVLLHVISTIKLPFYSNQQKGKRSLLTPSKITEHWSLQTKNHMNRKRKGKPTIYCQPQFNHKLTCTYPFIHHEKSGIEATRSSHNVGRQN